MANLGKCIGLAPASTAKIMGGTLVHGQKVMGLDVALLAACTLDPVNKGAGWALSVGNLVGVNTANNHSVYGTTTHATGKYYFELQRNTGNSGGANNFLFGVGPASLTVTSALYNQAAWLYFSSNGNKYYNTAQTAFGTAWNDLSDVVGCAIDIGAGKIWWSKAGTWQASGDPAAGTNPAYTGLSGTLYPIVSRTGGDGSVQVTARFKSADFSYAPPSGFGPWGG